MEKRGLLAEWLGLPKLVFLLAWNIFQMMLGDMSLFVGFIFFQYFWFNVSLLFFAFQGPSLKQFMDIFSLPEMTLLSSVIDYFITHGIEFDQVHLYKDISVSEMSSAPQLTPHQSCELCSTQTQGAGSDQPDMTALLSL